MRLFLDTLDSDAAEIVVRHLSSDARSILWHQHLDICDVLMLYRLNGVLGAVCRNLFNCFYSEDDSDLVNTPKEAGICGIMDEEGRGDVLDDISKEAGASFKRLYLASNTALKDVQAGKDELCARFPNVTELVGIVECIRNLLPYMGDRLHQLNIIDPCNAPFDASPCVQLRELEIGNGTPSFLKNSCMWERVGARLTKLKIQIWNSPRNDNVKEQIWLIRTHCPLLRDVNVSHNNDACLTEDVAKLYASYGNQLLHAHAYYMTASQCEMVLEECPNVILGLSLRSRHGNPAPALRQTCSRLRKLELFIFDLSPMPNELLYIQEWNILESLVLVSGVHNMCFLRSFFNARFPTLTEIEIDVSKTADQDDLLRCIARSISTLEKLRVEGLLDVPSSIDALVSANRNLAYVHLEVNMWHLEDELHDVAVAQMLSCISNVVGIFSEAAKLREICVLLCCPFLPISNSDMREQCKLLHRRRVYVYFSNMSGWEYSA